MDNFNFYSYGGGSITTTPLNISISGGGGFSPTNYSDDNFPSFSNFNQLPTIISKSAGFTFTFNNLINTTLTEVFVSNISQQFQGNTVTFIPSQLNGLSIGNFATLKVKCSNLIYPSIYLGGKNFVNVYTTEYYISGITIQN